MISIEKLQKWLDAADYQARLFSTCSRRQYFSIVLDDSGHVLGTGYNGGPSGSKHCNDGGCPRVAINPEHGSNYSNCIAIHAEANAIMHSDYSARRNGCYIIVNGPPCWDCAKLIANSGAHSLVCRFDPAYADWPRIKGSLESWGVTVYAFN